MVAFYCALCRQTDFSGKGHVYGKSHQSKLKVVLVKFLEKVKEARRTVKCPQVEKFDPAEHQAKFWCYCCSLEVQKHVSNGRLTVRYGGLLEHMSTRGHRKNTNAFWWRNKADEKLKEKFIISQEETERFKEEVPKALSQYEEKEDVLLKEQAAFIRAQEQHRLEALQALKESDPELQQNPEPGQQSRAEQAPCMSSDPAGFHTAAFGPSEEAGPSREDPFLQWTDSGLTFIGHQDWSGNGNVHTGAVPPWLLDDPEDDGARSSQKEMGPSLQGFLKHKQQEKLKKLPPNRVGANFDHGSRTGADWLPSFGRVWNNGRRWQSRHQFRKEEKSGQTRRRQRRDGGKARTKQKHLEDGGP